MAWWRSICRSRREVQDAHLRWACASRMATSRVPDGTDLGDTDTFTAMLKGVWTPSDNVSCGCHGSTDSKSDENGSPLVFAAMNEGATFPRVASLDAGCPGLTDGAVPPPGLPDQPRVPMINDARCANDFQARGSVQEQRHVAAVQHAREPGRVVQRRVRPQRDDARSSRSPRTASSTGRAHATPTTRRSRSCIPSTT